MDDEDFFDPEVALAAETREAERRETADEAVAAHIRRTKEVYTRVFKGASADDLDFLMSDLAFFVRLDEHFSPDDRLQCVMAGRKQVYHRILEYTQLDFDTLVRRYIQSQT